MEKLTIIYLGRKLRVAGSFQEAEPSVGIMEDDFCIDQVFDGSKEITYDFDTVDFDKMSELALVERDENNQTDWEVANVC